MNLPQQTCNNRIQVTQQCNRYRKSRSGLTLVEMLVSVTITLMVVFAIVQVFDMMGNTIAKGRSTIEMAGQLRSVSNLLQRDLDNLTCPVRPWVDPDAGLGYFEYVEGPRQVNLGGGTILNHRSNDFDHDADSFGLMDTGGAEPHHAGDIDDILAFTIRATGESEFSGTGPAGPQTSKFAEVIWWMALLDINGNQIPDDNDSPVLMRRVLLIRPDIDLSAADPSTFFFQNDISARIDDAGMLTANTIGDLTNRQNRFAHRPLYQDSGGEPAGFRMT